MRPFLFFSYRLNDRGLRSRRRHFLSSFETSFFFYVQRSFPQALLPLFLSLRDFLFSMPGHETRKTFFFFPFYGSSLAGFYPPLIDIDGAFDFLGGGLGGLGFFSPSLQTLPDDGSYTLFPFLHSKAFFLALPSSLL